MATLESTYGCTHAEAVAQLEKAGLTGTDGATSLSALERKLANGIAPRSYGADAVRAHAVLLHHSR